MIFTLSDLSQWGEALTALRAGTGRVVLGGGRAAELALDAEPQVGGPPDRVSISVDLVPSGDDPYPRVKLRDLRRAFVLVRGRPEHRPARLTSHAECARVDGGCEAWCGSLPLGRRTHCLGPLRRG